MAVGIEKMGIYPTTLYLDVAELAEARGLPVAETIDHLFVHRRSLLPLFEDTVTLAVNAADRLNLTEEEKADIELLIVGTESSVDFGKPVSTHVQRHLGLPHTCRNFETKHACYSGSAGYMMALHWLASNVRPGKKALVITSDYSRKQLGEEHEFVLGAAGCAMLLSHDPQILEVDLATCGYWTQEVADTFRPTSRIEMGNNQGSLYAYLDALEGSMNHWLAVQGGDVDFLGGFHRHVYHAPFGGMTFQAHRRVASHFGMTKKKDVRTHYDEKVAAQLHFGKQLGSTYSGSTFVGLAGMLTSDDGIKGGEPLTIFTYGSGSQGEMYNARFGPAAVERVRGLKIDDMIAERVKVSVAEYEDIETRREDAMDQGDYTPDRTGFSNVFEKNYVGRNRLVLDNIDNFTRTYVRV